MAKPFRDLRNMVQEEKRRTISESYRKLNEALHTSRPDYGASGARHAEMIAGLATVMKTESILDYGAGKQTLAQALPQFPVRSYDPCVPGIDALPEPADLVTCTDVLEHIEPEHLDAVLNDLKRVTRRLCYLTVATRPAKKTLPDGRNAHLIQQPYEWWLPRIWARFQIDQFQNVGRHEFIVIASPK